MFRRSADQASERLERALRGGAVPHDQETRLALAAAGTLAPAHGRSPQRIEQTREAMMREFMRAMNPAETREDAGSGDGLEEIALHRHEVALPGGGQLVVSDLEEITPERLDAAAEQYARILDRRSRDRQS
ncbi:hypothetical protein [Streptomyces subrutilus]|uniref:Uncharacterized protein n=1 Tax=Streptomyces subrutilus TaxID=36818 RepID=A0A1E5NXS7_9ACTN|nr:hypothetical protein [Streptomyces subrutilus]OEJ21015.1 hypothetical protein BGK67_34530 [Streptomyces subrutilus]